eukprot:scaffold18553_cov19-Tisochrysis_lutea.AAC.3
MFGHLSLQLFWNLEASWKLEASLTRAHVHNLLNGKADRGKKRIQKHVRVRLRVQVRSGHGAGKPTKKIIEEAADSF